MVTGFGSSRPRTCTAIGGSRQQTLLPTINNTGVTGVGSSRPRTHTAIGAVDNSLVIRHKPSVVVMTGTDATVDERGAEGTAETVEPVHAGEPVGTWDRSKRLNFAPGPRHPKSSSARGEDMAKRTHDKI